MEWYDIPDTERDRISKMSQEDLLNITKHGIQTEWWKFIKTRLSQTLKVTDAEMKKVKGVTLDECIKFASLKALYQTTWELFNLDENMLKMVEVNKNLIPEKKEEINTILIDPMR